MLKAEKIKKLKDEKSLTIGVIKGAELKEILKQLKNEGLDISNKYCINESSYYYVDIYHNNKFFKLFIH